MMRDDIIKILRDKINNWIIKDFIALMTLKEPIAELSHLCQFPFSEKVVRLILNS